MISTDFAPNETVVDAFLSLKLLFQPWKWQRGQEIETIKKIVAVSFGLDFPKFETVFFLSGRAALYHLLKSLRLNRSDTVMVQAFTCEAVILPILANDLKPVYVDIEKNTFSMDPIDLEKKIKSNTRVLILQHTFGLTPICRDKILTIIRKHNLVLIEDIAHGYNIEFQRSKLKDQKEIATNHYFLFSFGRSKTISSVFGGAVAGKSKTVMDNLQNAANDLRQPSFWFITKTLLYKPLAVIIKSTYDFGVGKLLHLILNKLKLLEPEITSREKRGEYDMLLDKKYPNALAVLLLKQLERFPKMQKQRLQSVKLYDQTLSKNNYAHTLLRYPLLVKNRVFLLAKAAKNNTYLGKWYDQVVSPKSLSLDRVEYKPGSCPTAEEICKEIINLPTNITKKEAKKIINLFN